MTDQTLPAGSFCWHELGTRDAAAAGPFYTRLFGWDSQDVPMPGDGPGSYTLFRLDGTDIGGMYQLDGPRFEGVPSHWAVYVSTDDVDATVARATAAGGAVAWPAMDIPGVGRMAGVTDPTGATICVFRAGEKPHRPDLGATIGAFCWSELLTNDPDRATAFYTDVFGWKVHSKDAGPNPYTEWANGGGPIGGMMKLDPRWGDVPSHWNAYVSVEDCDATVARATELGGSVMVPATTIPEVGRFSLLHDPTGAAIAVIWLDPAHMKK